MDTLDVPQADDLAKVRRVLQALAELSTEGPAGLMAITDRTAYSRRHTGYRLHAARILGLLRFEGEDALVLSDLGHRLLEAAPDSADERAVWARAVERSAPLAIIAPDLLDAGPLTAATLAERMEVLVSFGASTALRRAGCLLSWRRQILGLVVPDAAPPAEPATHAGADAPRGQLSLF